jgi:hypothetical protein
MADGALAAWRAPPTPVLAPRRLALVPAADGVQSGRYSHLPECQHEGARGTCQQRQCRYHLARRGYSEHQLTPTRDCALDVANEGPHTRDEVAAVLGISDERLRQIEERALARLKRNETLRRLHDESL